MRHYHVLIYPALAWIAFNLAFFLWRLYWSPGKDRI
jgi:hypothetical protein